MKQPGGPADFPECDERAGEKVVLFTLNSRYSHTSLALRSLRTYVQAHWPEAPPLKLIEATIHEPQLRLLRRLYEEQASVYAFSCYIWNIELISALTRQLRQVCPQALIVWGGPEASTAAEPWLLREPAIDLIVRGEGEAAFLALLKSRRQPGDADLSLLPGLSWRGGREGSIRHNPEAALLPAQDWPFAYTEAELRQNSSRIIYYESSRGCPFHCTYCLSATDRNVRFRPLDQTLAQLDHLIEARVRQVKLVDRTFNCDRQRALQIWRHLLQHRLSSAIPTNFHFEIAGDLLDDAAVDCLIQAPPGLFQLEIGVQTSQPHVLEAIRRPADLKQLQRQVSRLRQAGNVHLHLDLIAGLPGETLTQFAESFNFVFHLRPHQLQLGFLKVLAGTPMAIQAAQLAYQWQDQAPYEVLSSDSLTFAELNLLRDIAELLDAYWNQPALIPALSWLIGLWPDPWSFFYSLASWFAGQGGFQRALSPADRCCMLWQFGCSRQPQLAEEGWLSRAWLDLLRINYIESGQKDQPAWLGFWEHSAGAGQRRKIQADRAAFYSLWPQIRKWRADRICFSLNSFLAEGQLQPADEPVYYDLSGPVPLRLQPPV